MADNDDYDQAIVNFGDILSNLKKKFEITESKWTNERSYEIKFRTQIAIEHDDYNKHCDHWVDEFSYVTDTVWVHKTSNTGPKVKFRKQYQCWTYPTKEIDKQILFDARKCRGTLDIKVLGSSSAMKSTSRFLRLGMNVLIKINFQHLHPVVTSQDYSFFVHWCKPLAEAPKPAALSNERVSQLVAKVVENAPLTSQKAAERAKAALQRHCISSTNFAQSVLIPDPGTTHAPQNATSLTGQKEGSLAVDQPPIAQVIVNASNGQNSENIFYVHQVVFDSATQTLRDVLPASSDETHKVPDHQLLQVQVPIETTHISPIMTVQTNESEIIQNF